MFVADHLDERLDRLAGAVGGEQIGSSSGGIEVAVTQVLFDQLACCFAPVPPAGSARWRVLRVVVRTRLFGSTSRLLLSLSNSSGSPWLACKPAAGLHRSGADIFVFIPQ